MCRFISTKNIFYFCWWGSCCTHFLRSNCFTQEVILRSTCFTHFSQLRYLFHTLNTVEVLVAHILHNLSTFHTAVLLDITQLTWKYSAQVNNLYHTTQVLVSHKWSTCFTHWTTLLEYISHCCSTRYHTADSDVFRTGEQIVSHNSITCFTHVKCSFYTCNTPEVHFTQLRTGEQIVQGGKDL